MTSLPPALDVWQKMNVIRARYPRLYVVCCAVLSGLLGLVAWSSIDCLPLLISLIFLPLLFQTAGSRWGTFLVAWAYYETITRSVPGITKVFFPDLNPALIGALWVGHAALLAAPWALIGPQSSMRPLYRALVMFATLALLSAPPVGLFHWGSPLMVAGILFPGWRWLGLAATALLFALIAAYTRHNQSLHAALAVLGVSALAANMLYIAPAPPSHWKGESTALGSGANTSPDGLRKRETMLAGTAMQAMAQGYRVIVFPESISGLRNRSYPDIWGPVAQQATAFGATILIGREQAVAPPGKVKNALVIYGLHGGEGFIFASSQVPMPIGDWKIGFDGGVDTNIFGTDLYILHGEKVSMSMCYEDFLLWPHRGLFFGPATLLISVSNQWPSAGTSAERSQDISRILLARMAGVPLILAKNN